MSISNGVAANATNFNSAFVSRSTEQSISGGKSFAGYLAVTESAIATSATITAMSSSTSKVRFTGSTATQLQGITAGQSGQILIMYNASSASVTIKHQNSGASASARIINYSAGDVVLAAGDSILYSYDSTQSRWVQTGAMSSNLIALPVSIANGGTGQSTKVAGFDALSPMTTSGDIIYGGASGIGTRLPKGTDGQVLTLSSGVPAWLASTGGLGTNFINNANAETDTTGWSTYADAAGTSPVDGTGGSPTITWTRSTTGPLIGTASFIFTKDAANRQGQGASYAFTIDSAYQAKVLQISFEYQVASGTFAAGSQSTDSDITVWIYDVTNGVLIQPSTYKLFASSTSVSTTFVSNFQTASNSTSYRLILHCASTSASAYAVEFDNVVVSPSSYVYGSPISDWTAYTPTFTGFGTATGVEFYYRRVGDSIQIQGKFVAGTPTATEARITLPSGLTSSDSTKIPSIRSCGFWFQGATDTTHGGSVQIETSVAYMTFSSAGVFGSSSVNAASKANGNAVLATGATGLVNAVIPVQGWASNVQMSDQADSRKLLEQYTGNGGTSITANTTNIDFTTKVTDTHGAWSGTIFTAPVADTYSFTGSAAFTTGTNRAIYSYVNGNKKYLVSTDASSTVFPINGSIYLNAGDQLSFRCDISSTLINNANIHTIAISRSPSSSIISATEAISAKYFIAGSGVTSSTTAPINFATKAWDTHGAVTTGSSWKFTAPAFGRYIIKAAIATTSGTPNVSVYKNGSADSVTGNANAAAYNSQIGEVQLNAGDYIDLRLSSSLTLDSSTQQWVSIDLVK